MTTKCYKYTSALRERLTHFEKLNTMHIYDMYADSLSHLYTIFPPPGAHHSWAGKGNIEREVCPTLLAVVGL